MGMVVLKEQIFSSFYFNLKELIFNTNLAGCGGLERTDF